MNLIEIAGAGYTYGAGTPFAQPALHGVDLTVDAGEFLVIAGPARSGKSTLAQLCNGLLQPNPGTVTVDGVPIGAADESRRSARRTVGLVLQSAEAQLFAETVAEDIAFGPKNFGIPVDVDAALRAVALDPEEYRARGIEQLSGGQQRRVAIAGVLACQPKALVLDEPLAGIDPENKAELLAALVALAKAGTAVVVLSSSVADIAEFADRIVVLENGSVTAQGKPAELLAESELLARTGIGQPGVWSALAELSARGLPVTPELISPAAAAQRISAALEVRRGTRP